MLKACGSPNNFTYNQIKTVMKHKKTQFSVLLLGLGLTVQAQQAITASGSDSTGSGGSVAWSVGQVDYVTYSGTGGTISEGVQQAFEIFTVGIDETTMIISLSVFPIPTNGNLALQVHNFNSEKLSYQLFDLNGKLLESNPLKTSQTIISLGSLPSAAYFIKVTLENETLKQFIIIKN